MAKFEKKWRERLKKELKENIKEGFTIFEGQGKKNVIVPVPNCDIKMQFGDLRIQTPQINVVVEIESGGGVHNFLKYWPYLSGQIEEKPDRDFVLIHIYGSSYPTHKSLWRYFYAQLPSNLQPKFHLFVEGESKIDEVVKTIRSYLI